MPFVVAPTRPHTIRRTAAIEEDLSLSPILFPSDLDDVNPTNTSIPPVPPLPATLASYPVHNINTTNNYENDEEGEEDDAEDMFTLEEGITEELAFLHPWITSAQRAPTAHRHHHNVSPTGGSNSSSRAPLRRTVLPSLRGSSFFQDLSLLSPPVDISGNSNISIGYPEDRHNHHHLYHRRHHPHRHLRFMQERRLSLTPSYRRSYHSSHNRLLGDETMDLSYGCSTQQHNTLDFEVVMEDGGRYSAYYSVENILRNDDSVYCSGRSGTINILLKYCGSPYCHPVMTDKSCVLSRIIIKSPQHGFTAPCKEGMFFISHDPIDVDGTSKFDRFSRKDFDNYIASKGGLDNMEDQDPVAWFSISHDNQDVIDLNDRVCKYVLMKLLRAEHESENIDLQHVALIGYSGARSFGNARLC